MINFFKQVFKKGDLRNRILFTLGMLFIFRLGAAITIPTINADALTAGATNSGIIGLINMLGGGMLERFSIFSLGVSPYITASIIIELLSMDVIPVLTQWTKEGNTGKKKKDAVTRYVMLALAAIQGGSLTYMFDRGYGILTNPSVFTYVFVVVMMMAGSCLAMWFADQITQKGIGNGTSLLIFTGIVATLPNSFATTIASLVSFESAASAALGILSAVLFIAVYLIIVIFVIYNEGAVRKIPIMYATSSNAVMRTKDSTHMPLKINSAGVLPVIFASSILAAPRTIISFLESNSVTQTIDGILNYQQPIGFILYIVLIVFFAFFYSNLQIDCNKISKDLKKNGGSIPGVRTGEDTERYFSKVLNRITVVGALFLVIIASIPVIAPVVWSQAANSSLTLGGTGLIIVTGVALETTKQIKNAVTRKEYHGYIRK